MRNLIILALTLGLTTNSFAVVKRGGHHRPPEPVPEEEQARNTRLGFYLAPVLKVTEIQDNTKAMLGIRGGLEFNRSFYVGLAGYGLPHYHHRGDTYYDYGYYDYYGNDDGWDWGYGGVEFGIIAGRPRSGQLSFGVLLGGGGIRDYRYYGYDYRDRSFFVMEPQLDLMADVSRHVRLSLGASYRFVDDTHSDRYTKDDLRGASINFAIGFGSF